MSAADDDRLAKLDARIASLAIAAGMEPGDVEEAAKAVAKLFVEDLGFSPEALAKLY